MQSILPNSNKTWQLYSDSQASCLGDFHIHRIASSKSSDLFLKNCKHLCDVVGGFFKVGRSSPTGS